MLADRARMDELFECVFDDDAWVRMRAIDTIEKVCRVHPDWLLPYKSKLFHELADMDQASIQWHLAEIFPAIELTPDEERRAIEIMKRNISSTDADWIVAANTMKTLAQFAQEGKVPATEIIPLFEIQKSHRSKAVVKRAMTLLEEIA